MIRQKFKFCFLFIFTTIRPLRFLHITNVIYIHNLKYQSSTTSYYKYIKVLENLSLWEGESIPLYFTRTFSRINHCTSNLLKFRHLNLKQNKHYFIKSWIYLYVTLFIESRQFKNLFTLRPDNQITLKFEDDLWNEVKTLKSPLSIKNRNYAFN